MPASLLAVTKLGKLAGLHACVTPLAVKFSISIIITGSQISQLITIFMKRVCRRCPICRDVHLASYIYTIYIIVMDVLDFE